MRLAALWLILFAAYAATLGVPARAGVDYGGSEAHHLLAAESLVADGDVDLANQYRDRDYAHWYPGTLRTDGTVVQGRLVEPHGIGYALLIAPAYDVGGPKAVQIEMAALLALALVLGAALARRIVPEPWAGLGALLAGLSPPALAAGTTVTPSVPAAVALTGAALCALKLDERARRRHIFGGALLLATLPWLGWTFIVPGVAVAFMLVRRALRERRRMAALFAGEALAASLVFYATLNDRFYGGWTPRAAGAAAVPDFPLGYVERLPRLASLWLDRDYGLIRWVPVIALAFVGCWQLYRSRRDQLARVAPARRAAEAAARLALAIVLGQLLVTALAAADPRSPGLFPGVDMIAALPAAAALTAWGLRHVPRPVAALLGLLTLGASAWVGIDLLTGHASGWLAVSTSAPWGPLVNVFPSFAGAPAWPIAACALIALGVVALALHERRELGEWRRSVAAARTSRAMH